MSTAIEKSLLILKVTGRYVDPDNVPEIYFRLTSAERFGEVVALERAAGILDRAGISYTLPQKPDITSIQPPGMLELSDEGVQSAAFFCSHYGFEVSQPQTR